MKVSRPSLPGHSPERNRKIPDSPFFRVETRPFEPAFSPGDRLVFDLALNATTDVKVEKGDPRRRNRRRLDVAIAALLAEEQAGRAERGDRASRRVAAAETAARAWLEARGGRDGFRLLGLGLSAYRIERLPRGRPSEHKRPAFGVTDLTGLTEVVEPALFLARVLQGFGRAKAFGCGLMLLRRAP